MRLLKCIFSLCLLVPSQCRNKCFNSLDTCNSSEIPSRYILYDVNSHEGFNLRRDVYMRLAIFLKQLNRTNEKYYLVLPPWNDLPHWRSKSAGNQSNLPWGLFFNLKNLQEYTSVVEAYEFFEDHPGLELDHVLILQHFRDLWAENFTWSNKWSIENCQQSLHHDENANNEHKIIKYGSYYVAAKNIQCLSLQGPASLLEEILDSFNGKSILFLNAETVLHDYFGNSEYWKCRESMQFSDSLKQIALEFKNSTLSVSNKKQNYSYNLDYYEGEPYLCVHFRRRDYIRNRPMNVPTIEFASVQIKEKMITLNLDTVFVATDTNEKEFENLRNLMKPFRTVRFNPSLDILQIYKDGGIAIIEQIVCSHAMYFIGSYESTFSFRIQEERELLNFNPDTTFNRLCGDSEKNCKQPTRWLKYKL